MSFAEEITVRAYTKDGLREAFAGEVALRGLDMLSLRMIQETCHLNEEDRYEWTRTYVILWRTSNDELPGPSEPVEEEGSGESA